jgi:hypothetical protein
MTDRSWKSKGDKVPRRSPRKTGKTCGRPFKALRKKGKTKLVAEVEDSDVPLVELDKEVENDSQVQCITESQNKRDMEGKEEAEPIRINPYPNGIRLMSDREATECARYGEVLRWSSDEEDKTKEKTKDTSVASDTTASTPECLKSPETIMTRIPGSVVTDRIGSQEIQSRRKPSGKDEVEPDRVYAGVKFVPETEQNDGSGDSEDNVPVARLLRPKNKGSLTFQQIKGSR